MNSHKHPAITVAIPFFNAEPYLADAIRSVFAQTFTDWELLLLDDGSTDGSLAIARAVNDPRVRVISDGRNRKLATRLNEVTELARGEFIARMDADDLMDPERLRVLHDMLQRHPELDLVSCGLYSARNDLTLIGVRGQACCDFTTGDLIHKRKGFVHAALLARKTWYHRNRYNPELPPIEDAELWVRAASLGDFKAASIANPLYVYREEGNVMLEKLLRAYALERKHISRLIDSRLFRILFMLRSLLKSSVAWLLASAGALAWLQARRNTGVPAATEVAAYQALIMRIASTQVPGLKQAEEGASSPMI